ncbi:hypothetical protein GGS23DRAFT_598606 [Durotheca rogersii]|uniref:uncharacterized protein n=1 Tax=Durotheca rogersii TaxID=419775 RepID=UPI00221E5572|nr:uncharacterized protein GGS23DRAFT_598606 [Durotheca rogersii]KAI5861453.1 hypothetical protein GGS23DRAFT_598606 [Durotheca rogersii]
MAPSTLQPSTSGLSVGAASEKATDLAEQKEIEAIWKEVNNKVVELAGGDPTKIQKTLDIDAVLKFIDGVQDSDKEKSEKFGLFKKIVGRTLQCINTVGGLVAEGASTVFAPAGMCYNALTFVIQAWQGYEGIFENLAELLEKCVEFLERLESYQGRMDFRLTRVACQNLRLFVEICDRTIKLRRKHKRFLAFTKQLFLNDNGIQDLLSMMDRLNAKESLLVNAQTYRIVSDSAGDVKLILETQKEQKKEDEAKKWRRKIAKTLGFPGTTLDVDGEPIPTWQRTFDSRKNTLVGGTGEWLKDDQVFCQWVQSSSLKRSAVVLEGKNGSGKTSAMANALRCVRKGELAGPTSRTVSVYFFMDSEKRKPEDEDTSSILELVSRILLWQIATSYEAMTKSVYQIIERSPDFDGTLDLWQQLFVNNKERMNSDTTFFLFVDGLDKTLVELFRKLTSVPDDKKARVFLTARTDIVSDWLDQDGGLEYDIITLSDQNNDDIDKYITDRMDNMPILKDSSRPGIDDWRNRILETLRRKCDGDYFKLNTSLDALSKVDLVDDIKEVLRDADKTRTDQIDSEIRRLNRTRTVKEIQEINEIMLWVETGRSWYSVEIMEAILSVKYRARDFPDALTAPPTLTRRKTGVSVADEGETQATLTISLLPFAQKLAEKYPIFTITDTGYVDWRSSEIVERIPEKGSQQDALFDVAAYGQQVIQESEISIVRHFLNNVCPPELYARFGFEGFFDAMLGAGRKDYICLDSDNANIKIALTCLTILTEEELRSNKVLRQYSVNWLLDHLKEVDLAIADRDLKGRIGPLLVKFLTEECGIDSMFWPFDTNVSMNTWDQNEYKTLHEARCEWVYSMSGVQELSRWFHDSSVTKHITEEPGVSLVAAVKAPSANLHEVLYSYAAKELAHHLFRRVEFTPRQFLSACWFIRGYLSRIDPEKSSRMPSEPDPYRDEDSEMFAEYEGREFSLDHIAMIEAWAAKVLDKQNDSLVEQASWEIHGALITFQLCPFQHGAVEIYQARARKTVQLDPKNWHACHFIAKQPNTSSTEAVDLLSRAKKAIDELRKEDEDWIKDHANSSLLARITLDLGDRLWDQGEDDARAASIHRESLDYDYVHFVSYVEVLLRYRDREAWGELIAFVEALNAASDSWAAFFDELVNEFVFDIVHVRESDMLARAADATGRWDVVEKFFTLAIGVSHGIHEDTHDLLFLVRDGFARTLASAADPARRDKAMAIQETALQDIRPTRTESLSRHAIEAMTDSLAQTYLDRAFREGVSAEEAAKYGDSLAGLLPDMADVADLWMNSVTACCLIRFHHKRGSGLKLAQDWTQHIVRTSIELLSDDDEENDDMAYWMFARLTNTVDDVRNNRITWALRNMVQYNALQRWQKWVDAEKEAAAANGANGAEDESKTAAAPQPPDGDREEKAGDAPGKPTWFVSCDGCDREWAVMSETLHSCADCVGALQLCAACLEKLRTGELEKSKPDLRCRPQHEFIEVPSWDPRLVEGMPRGYVPLPDGGAERWISMDQWKAELRKKYLDGDAKK